MSSLRFALIGLVAVLACEDDEVALGGVEVEDGGSGESPLEASGDASTPVARAWAFGDNSTRLYFDGAHWSVDAQDPLPSSTNPKNYYGAWLGPSSLWVVGNQFVVIRYRNGAWEPVPFPPAPTPDGGASDSGLLTGIWGTAETDVWVVEANLSPGNRPFWHWDGTAWTHSADSVSGLGEISAIHGVASNDIWAAGTVGATLSLVLYHYDGSHWTVQTAPTEHGVMPIGLVGFSSADFWLGGAAGTWRWDGISWTSSPKSGAACTSFFGTGDGDLWAAAPSGTLHYDGSAWSPAPVSVIPTASALGGVSTKDMWAVGPQGAAARYDGATWTAFTTGTTNALHAVIGLPNLGK